MCALMRDICLSQDRLGEDIHIFQYITDWRICRVFVQSTLIHARIDDFLPQDLHKNNRANIVVALDGVI